MKKNFFIPFLYLVFTVVLSGSIFCQVDTKETRLMTQPAISKDHIAFVYANDLWVSDLDGKNIRRLTVDEGIESNPRFSPDGKLIAFSAEYDGNTDVFVVPVEGGVPKRLTWHPGSDIVRGFTPDGSAVLFISSRNDFSFRYTQLFTVPINGSLPDQLKIPNAFKASYSPDGKMIAYVPIPERFRQWKHYRGGTASVIQLFKFSDNSIEKIPQPDGRCNDTDPMWMGDQIYFISDRNGEFNLFSYDIKTKEIKQLTEHNDFPIQYASMGDGKIVYEQAGYLFVYDTQSKASKKLNINIGADLIRVRSHYVKGSNYIRWSSISPTGARAVFEVRGEIVTLPAEKGDPRNLTNTRGANERSPIWSPDGKNIAYFSDESGEYELCIASQDGKGTVKKFKLGGAGFYELPIWSPDNQKISFLDNSSSLYFIDVKTGDVKKIASEYLYNIFKTTRGVWSPDSKWIVYTLNTKDYIQKVYLYSVEKDKSYPVTDGMSEVSEPVFDKSGKHLYFFGSTNAGPAKQWLELSSEDMRQTNSIYLAVLKKEGPSPLAKESDEEKGIEKKEDKNKDKDKPKKDDKEKPKKEESISIDFEDLNLRILSLPIPIGNYSNLQAGNDGEFYYLEAPFFSPTPEAAPKLHKYDLNKRKDEVIIQNVRDYNISEDRNKILYLADNSWWIAPNTGKLEPGKGKLNTEGIEILIDPRSEWKQIYNEAWRINRDYFYDPNMHGTDWKAMKEKYTAFLPHLSCRNDLNRLIQWLCSELVVGHSYSGGGDLGETKKVPGGLIGADYVIENGRYKFKKVFGGLNWNPGLRSPLTEPGINVKAGEYLLAVNGKDLRPPTNIYSMFENTAGKIVEITVGPNPDGSSSRTVSVVPIADEGSLRNRDWVEGNLKKVDDATNGRVAYVYLPNTATQGHDYFQRYFFPQAHKDAIIIDERFNGGGSIADYYIDILKRTFVGSSTTRYGANVRSPFAAILGPKVMIIDETAGSGGDMLPWMFRQANLGKIIGKRTWGGLVGILGFPVLMDGGYITSPNIGLWSENGWIAENEGIPPDIEVEQTPAEIINGHDPQLEKAIQVIMEELKTNPPKEYKQPPFPVKVKK